MLSSKARWLRSGTLLMVAISTYVRASLVSNHASSLLTRSQPSVIVNATCFSEYSWMNNGKGQSPCVVAAWEQEPCASTPWTINALTSYDSRYLPPNTTTATACTCSWAAYNLLSACTVCQNSDDFLPWGEWHKSCGSYVSNTTYFPSDQDITLPSETAIPYWAGTNPETWNNAVFDEQQAQAIHNQEHADLTGAPIPATSSKKSNKGAIVGGAVGGVALVLLAVAFFIWGVVQKRKRLRQQRQKTYPGGPDRPDMQHMRSMSDSSQKYLDPNGYGMPPGLQISPLMLPMTNGAQPMSHPLQNLSSPVAQSISLPMPPVPQMNGMVQVPGAFPTGGIVTHAPAPSTSPVQRHMPSASTQSIGGVMSSVVHAPPGSGAPAVAPPTNPEDIISPFITPPTSPQPTSRKGAYDFSDEDPPSSSKSPASSVSAQRTRMNPPAYTSAPVSGEVRAVAPTPSDQKYEYRGGVSPENNQDGTGVGTGVATYGSPLEAKPPMRWGGSTATATSDAEGTVVSEYSNDSKQRPMDSFSDVIGV